MVIFRCVTQVKPSRHQTPQREHKVPRETACPQGRRTLQIANPLRYRHVGPHMRLRNNPVCGKMTFILICLRHKSLKPGLMRLNETTVPDWSICLFQDLEEETPPSKKSKLESSSQDFEES